MTVNPKQRAQAHYDILSSPNSRAILSETDLKLIEQNLGNIESRLREDPGFEKDLSAVENYFLEKGNEGVTYPKDSLETDEVRARLHGHLPPEYISLELKTPVQTSPSVIVQAPKGATVTVEPVEPKKPRKRKSKLAKITDKSPEQVSQPYLRPETPNNWRNYVKKAAYTVGIVAAFGLGALLTRGCQYLRYDRTKTSELRAPIVTLEGKILSQDFTITPTGKKLLVGISGADENGCYVHLEYADVFVEKQEAKPKSTTEPKSAVQPETPKPATKPEPKSEDNWEPGAAIPKGETPP